MREDWNPQPNALNAINKVSFKQGIEVTCESCPEFSAE